MFDLSVASAACIFNFNFWEAAEASMVKTCPSCVYTCHLLDLSFHLMHTPKFHLFHKFQKNREAIYGFGVLWCSFSLSNLFSFPRPRVFPFKISCLLFEMDIEYMSPDITTLWKCQFQNMIYLISINNQMIFLLTIL